MFKSIYTFSPFGYEGAIVQVETDLRRGIPSVDIVGMADGAVKETRERVLAAVRNSGLEFPMERVLIALSPCDLRKEGGGFDLPIAFSVLNANETARNPDTQTEDVIGVIGELELSGKVRAVKGIHAFISSALAGGIDRFVIPKANESEVKAFANASYIAVESLEQVMDIIKGNGNFIKGNEKPIENDGENEIEVDGVFFQKQIMEEPYDIDLDGQNGRQIKALALAISGHHNLMQWGAPGNGKTMFTQKMMNYAPRLTVNEMQSVSRIWSLAGLMKPSEPLKKYPPIRIPHQTASIEGICGGGPTCRPGEISLAHNGILFFDETAEFRSSVLQMLRVPIENKSITLSRAGRSTTYPADFIFIGASGLCPCGNYGSKDKICLCSIRSVELYQNKISAPLMDRCLSIHTDFKGKTTYTKEQILEMIATSTKIQRERGRYNNDLSPKEVNDLYLSLDEKSKSIVNRYIDAPRKRSLLIKAALTNANLYGRENITLEDVKEIADNLMFNPIADVENYSMQTEEETA